MESEKIMNNLSVDCIIYSFQNKKINVLLVKHAEGPSKGDWGLPGGWVKFNESIDKAAHRVLKYHTNVDSIYLQQLKTFGEVDRYPDYRAVTIAYFSLVKYTDVDIKSGLSVLEAKWVPVDECPILIYDHNKILEYGNNTLKQMVRYKPIGFRLLPVEFTLLQLQSLYEAILNTKFDKPNFRRKLFKMKFLTDTGKKQQKVSHRAANLYSFEREKYEKLKLKGFTFDL